MSVLQMSGKLVLTGKIKTLTGLHIGGSSAGLEIGGVDNSVIKDERGRPYIPGSSLKGKLRSLLEKSEGLVVPSSLVITRGGRDPIRMHMCDRENCVVCLVFGRANGAKTSAQEGEGRVMISNTTPSRLLVRDARLIPDSIPPEVRENIDLEWTEVKYENSIDRITSAANPRQTERVPRGAEFDFSMVYTIFDKQDRNAFAKVTTAMRLLEDDYLGGSGSRGYGQVCFNDLKLYYNSVEDYELGNVNLETKEPWLEADNLSQLLEALVGPDGLNTLDG